MCLPVAVELTASEASDYFGFAPLMAAEGPEAKVLLADRGYDANHVRETMEARGAATVIPTRKNRKVQIPVDGYIYAQRNRIERCLNKFKNSRLNFRLVISTLQFLGHDLIFVSTKPAAGQPD